VLKIIQWTCDRTCSQTCWSRHLIGKTRQLCSWSFTVAPAALSTSTKSSSIACDWLASLTGCLLQRTYWQFRLKTLSKKVYCLIMWRMLLSTVTVSLTVLLFVETFWWLYWKNWNNWNKLCDSTCTKGVNSVTQWQCNFSSLCFIVVSTERQEMEQKQKQPTPSLYFSNHGSVLTRRIAGIEQVAALIITLCLFFLDWITKSHNSLWLTFYSDCEGRA